MPHSIAKSLDGKIAVIIDCKITGIGKYTAWDIFKWGKYSFFNIKTSVAAHWQGYKKTVAYWLLDEWKYRN